MEVNSSTSNMMPALYHTQGCGDTNTQVPSNPEADAR
jgi:hypothetical protein